MKQKRIYVMISFVFAFAFFIMGMEEVSWCQRYLVIKTPASFIANMQQEMNLHNFATDEMENFYDFSTFLFFVVLFFIYDKTNLFKDNKCISFFIPSRFILFISAILMSYNYDRWNILFVQYSYFITICILVHYTWSAFKGVAGLSKDKRYLCVLLGVYILTQTFFIVRGNTFLRIWDVTEYREFFISFCFLAYSLEILYKLAKVNSLNTAIMRQAS